MAPGIATAGGGRRWETEFVAALTGPGAPLTVVRRCADMADVLATASTGQLDACVVAADLRALDGETIAQLAGFGVRVVVVHGAADTRLPDQLHRMGAAGAVDDEAGAAAIVASVIATLERPAGAVGDENDPHPAGTGADGDPDPGRHSDVPDEGPPLPRTPGGVGSTPHHDASPGDAVEGPRHTRRRPDRRARRAAPRRRRRDRHQENRPDDVPARGPGRVIGVWGPGGAPGRSTVAAGLADESARAGRATMLIDADVYGGVLASAFGLLDESAGLAGACRLATNGRLDMAELMGLCWQLSPRLTVLTGISRADRWPELRPSAIPAVIDLARAQAELVVVDCAAVLETDEEITFDTLAPRRNGATLAALGSADLVLAVGSADPPGMERLLRGLAELGEAVPGCRPSVVLNRVRSSAASPGELVGAVRRFGETEPIAMLPYDRESCDTAWRRGAALAEAAPKSRLTKALRELAQTVASAPASSEPTAVPASPSYSAGR